MKKFLAIFGTLILIGYTGIAVAKVIIREVPLKWEETAKLDGAGLYGNFCAVCHGASGKGDGPAVNALTKEVPDLTTFSANNEGVYPRRKVESAIYGDFRKEAHGTIDMPVWGQQFLYARPDWSQLHRKAYTRERIRTLNTHIESLQVQ
jgi:mono/diheme cytochrome c family protein